MIAIILDTETSGVTLEHSAIEVAVTLYHCVKAAPIATFATLIESPSNDAEHINRISPDLLRDAMPADAAWARVGELAKAADCFVAHNAPFDRRFTPNEIESMKPWICSQRDIEWPREVGENRKLGLIAISLGVPVIGAHRALTDVDILVRCFQRMTERGVDVADLLREALREKPLWQACVSFEQKDVAKAAGFTWEPPPKKRWTKRMSREKTKELPFRVVELKG